MVLIVLIITGVNIYESYVMRNGSKLDTGTANLVFGINIAAGAILLIVLILCVWFLVSRLNSQKSEKMMGNMNGLNNMGNDYQNVAMNNMGMQKIPGLIQLNPIASKSMV